MKNEIEEVASYWYRTFGNQKIPFDDFILKNQRLLWKLSRYQFGDWSSAIEKSVDLADALILLNARFGTPYRIFTVKSTKIRYRLLYSWERKWGKLSREHRIAFIGSTKLNALSEVDLDILYGLFDQHRKFDSVITHINRIVVPISDDNLDWDRDALSAIFDDTMIPLVELDDYEITTLSDQVGINIDWDPEELDSERIMGMDLIHDEF